MLDTAFGWKSIFAFIGLFAAVVLIWATFELAGDATVAAGEGSDFLAAIAQPARATASFLGYVLVAALGSATFFVFLGGAPHVVITHDGPPSAEYGVWFASSRSAIWCGNFVASPLSRASASTP